MQAINSVFGIGKHATKADYRLVHFIIFFSTLPFAPLSTIPTLSLGPMARRIFLSHTLNATAMCYDLYWLALYYQAS